MKNQSNRPICVDLFCGAGGLSRGLEMAGFHPVVAVDFDANATRTYKANHPGTHVINGDICKLTVEEIREQIGARELDLLAGGPSCQGYSTHGKRDPNDPRNFLFEHYLRIAEGLKPKWILMENVQGLLTYNNGYFREAILSRLQEMGYHADAKVLLAADYGVPQLRRRIFFVATRLDVDITFPEPTHARKAQGRLKPYRTVGEALSDLPEIADTPIAKYRTQPKTEFQKYLRGSSHSVSLHIGRPLSDQASMIAAHVKEGYGLRSVPAEILPDRFKKMRKIGDGSLRKDCTTLYHRLSRLEPAYTITCHFRNIASGPFLHPTMDRSLTPREAARLMTFPDDYIFEGVGVPRQIGNAVPPLMGKVVGEHLLKLEAMARPRAYSRKQSRGGLGASRQCQLTFELTD